MNILFASAEVSPFAKVGGLADVAGSLPKAIKEKGHDIRVMMPAYGSIDYEKYDIVDLPNPPIIVQMGGRDIPISFKYGKLPGSDVTIYFLANDEYFGNHHEVYPQHMYYRFEQERFTIFSKAVLEGAMMLGFQPDVIHCNDWHTGSIPVFLKEHYKWSGFHSNIKTLFSIHNLAYQGKYSEDILDFTGLSHELKHPERLEFYDDINWMKGAMVFADKITTVSEKYAQEILTPDYGEGLDGLLRWKTYKLSGILNGLDYSVWNPEEDKTLVANYSANDLAGKAECKKAIQKEYDLAQESKTPLIGLVSRLVDQKGLDILAGAMEELAHMDLQFVVLGSGDWGYEQYFKELSNKYDNIGVSIGYDSKLAERIYSGCDMFLMPSKFEPCGLGQLIALKYGTLPVVRETGGLADTVQNYNPETKEGNGFSFWEYSSYALVDAVKRACATFKKKKDWETIVKYAMQQDFSWKKSADKYIELYQNLSK